MALRDVINPPRVDILGEDGKQYLYLSKEVFDILPKPVRDYIVSSASLLPWAVSKYVVCISMADGKNHKFAVSQERLGLLVKRINWSLSYLDIKEKEQKKNAGK